MQTFSEKYPRSTRLFLLATLATVTLVVLASFEDPRSQVAIENFEVATFIPYETCAGETGFRVIGTDCPQRVAMIDNLSIQFLSTDEE